MDIRMYIMTHKEFRRPEKAGYIPLHVGSQGKTKLGYQCDNEGAHISGKNSSFCELTGLYWIWKNVRCDIVGLCHYRRYFVKKEMVNLPVSVELKILDIAYIEKCLENYDLIVPNSGMTQEESVYSHYNIRHHIKDLQVCGEIIKEKYPEYYDAFEWSLSTNFVSLGNMIIARKELLDKYCEWLFDILFEAEKRIDISDYDDYQKRVFGFLSERLFRVWMMSRELRVREEIVEQIEL